jgi:ketosteroid isomerase-like protein
MADEIIQRIREGYRAWNSDDLEATLSFLDPEVEWRTSASFPGTRPVYHGHDGFKEFWEHLHEPFDNVRIEIESLERDEDMALIRLRFHGRSKASGVELDLPWFPTILIEDDKVKRSALDRAPGDALEALDLAHRWPEF